MKKSILLAIFFAIMSFSVGFAQETGVIKLKTDKNKFEVQFLKSNEFTISNSISEIRLKSENTKKGEFINLYGSNLVKTFNKGMPDIPVISKLIEVPQNAKVKITVVSYNEEIVDLGKEGFNKKIMPSQLSLRKDIDSADIPFYYNEKIYKTDAFYSQGKIAVYKDEGQIRDSRIGHIQIMPFAYNPVKNLLKVYNNIKLKIEFINADWSKTEQIKKKYVSAFFTGANTSAVINSKMFNLSSKALVQSTPVTYVIVADPSFHDALQPFVQWKTMKGFKVIEAYTDDPNVGNTVASIKAYLQDLYDNPPTGQNPPSFILIVGDIDKIPAAQHTEVNDNPYSDLDYAEYTGDYLPEVNFGRWSADNATQVTDIANKTIRYEKYEMADPSYLGQTFLIAGDDEGHEDTYGGGAIYYADRYYANSAHGIYSHTFLQSTIETWGGNTQGNAQAHDSIITDINNGVALANYTAHCSPDGWYSPSFTQNDLNNYITNTDKFGLWIANCCQSNKFDENEAFAELAIRKPNAGVIGYIGGSQYTYWDEDYWWGVGFGNIVSQPTYESTTEGSYDGVFHDQANETDDISRWFPTNYQMILAGNLAVEASTSSLKPYYWVIYQLAGDPSVSSYIGVPEAMTVTPSPAALMMGMTSLNVSSAPYAYVALSQNGTLIAAGMSDNTGNASLTFASDALYIGDADLVVTCQNKQPYIGTITVSPADEPYVVLNAYTTSASPDYGQSITLNVTLENIAESGSGYDAGNVNAVISTSDSYVTITDSTETYGTIIAGEKKLIDNAFAITIADNVPDQHIISLDMVITADNGYSWDATINVTANAPLLEIGSLVINDITGNNNNILDPGENADIVIQTTNNGNADISNVIGTIISGSTNLVINNFDTKDFTLSVGETKLFVFNVTANANTEENTTAAIQFSVSGGLSSQYTANKDFNIIIGYLPEYGDSYATSSSDSKIDEVIFNNEINNNTSDSGCAVYSDFSYMVANVIQGETDTLFLTIGTCGGNYTKAAKVFIDWNGDHDFKDYNEEVFVSKALSSTFKDTVPINIPYKTKTGNVRMRIICKETSDPSNITPSGTYDWGETEDYTLNIALPVTQGGFLSAENSQICEGSNSGLITLTNYSGTITKWEKRLNNGTWINIANTQDTYSETLTEGIWEYRVETDNGLAYSDTITITANPNSTGGIVSGGDTICEGNYTGTLLLQNHTGYVTNWERKKNENSWEYILNNDTSFSEIPANDGTWYYRAVIQSGMCSKAFSDSTVVVVLPSAVSGQVSSLNTNICTETGTTLKLENYEGSIQWQESPNNSDWSDITGAIYDTYTSQNLTENTFFRSVVSLGTCNDKISNSVEIKITKNPVASYTFTSDNQTIKFNNTSENATNYMWDFGDNNNSTEINPTHIYNNDGTYTVSLLTSNGICPDDEFSENITVIYVNIPNIDKYISIVPNPNNGLFTIHTEGFNISDSKIEIYSINGKLVYENKINSDIFEIDLSNQAKGIYFVKITSDHQIKNTKLIIQ